MRRIIGAILLAVAVSSNVGCALPIYSADPTRRTQQLVFTSENLRLLVDEWERIWLLDQPDHSGPIRTHGGIL
jgi:hypothetical protein